MDYSVHAVAAMSDFLNIGTFVGVGLGWRFENGIMQCNEIDNHLTRHLAFLGMLQTWIDQI